MNNLSTAELGKFISAQVAIGHIQDGMKIGLGTGSTAAWLVRLLAYAMKQNGLNISACTTSSQTTALAQSLGMKIYDLDALGRLDLAIDGADEFDPAFNLIKGGGGALLQEKIVATMADRFVVITDASKQVECLGAFPLPVEVVQFGWQSTLRLIEYHLNALGYAQIKITRRGGDAPFITDEGHFIFDLNMKAIKDVHMLCDALISIPGVVETGLFITMCHHVIMGDGIGIVKYKSKGHDWVQNPFDLAAHQDLIAAVKE